MEENTIQDSQVNNTTDEQTIIEKLTNIDNNLGLLVFSNSVSSDTASGEEETIQIDYTNILNQINNNVVTIGCSIIFCLSILIGISLGKVLKLWKS